MYKRQGEKSLEYLAGERLIPIYRFLYAVCAALGCMLSLDSVWKAADTFNGLMAIPNMIALALLSRDCLLYTSRCVEETALSHGVIEIRNTLPAVLVILVGLNSDAR